MGDKGFVEYIMQEFDLNDIEFRSIKVQVETKAKQVESDVKDKYHDIKQLQKAIDKINKKKRQTSKDVRSIFKKERRIKRTENSIKRGITFGGKEVLKDLVKLYNKKESQKKIDKQTALWHERRVIEMNLLGEANQKGNRFFDFRFDQDKIIYKPYKGKKIEITYGASKNLKKELLRLQPLIESKELSITVFMGRDTMSLAYDDAIVSGYYVNTKERTRECNEIKKEEGYSDEERTRLIKDVYKKYYEELRLRMLGDKLFYRYCAIDNNPNYMGWVIVDRVYDGTSRLIKKGFIDISALDEKLNLSSDDPKAKHQKNKKKYETIQAIRCLFAMFMHHKVAHFVIEDLEGIDKAEASEDCHEFNRQVKNNWNRKLISEQITKRCTTAGIELIPVNPKYSSFIGNLTYDYADPTNAALEICRRGIKKYTQEEVLPQITGTIRNTMSRLLDEQNIELKPRDDSAFKDCKMWSELYKIASHNGLRWRWSLDQVSHKSQTFSIGNINSGSKQIVFN